MASKREIVVVGAGIIGLSTAIRLAEGGYDVMVVTADDPLATTSTSATGMVGLGFAEPFDKAVGWRRSTVTELTGDFDRGVGVRPQSGLLASRRWFEPPDSLRELQGFRVATDAELPGGFVSGFWLDMIAVDLDLYLPSLVDRLSAAGATITRGTVDDFESIEADAVVNCCGFGAGRLVDDPDLRADWGMHVIVGNEVGLDHHFMEMPAERRWISWMPHGDRILIGGASVLDREDDATDSTIETELLDTLGGTRPDLAACARIGANAGVRPGRSAVRVEAETLSHGRTLVHNYGHGGRGLTLSWGTADEVVSLLADPHATSPGVAHG
ncbi:MAG: FAD-dependent oxidoreductase [Actinomycetota bacterium]